MHAPPLVERTHAVPQYLSVKPQPGKFYPLPAISFTVTAAVRGTVRIIPRLPASARAISMDITFMLKS